MVDSKFKKVMYRLIFTSLLILVSFMYLTGPVTAISHILLVIPLIYFLFESINKREFNLSKSQIALMMFLFFAIISIIASPDSASKFKSVRKLKYFFIGLLSVYAYRSYIYNYMTEKHKKVLLWMLLVSASLASLTGLIGVVTGFNPLRFREAVSATRSSGAYGNIMTYGYGMQIGVILFIGAVLYCKSLKSLVRKKWIIIATIINIIGIYYSGCRGAFMGVACALPFLIYKTKNKRLIISSLIIMIIGISVSLGILGKLVNNSGQTTNRILSANQGNSNGVRVSQYKAAIYAFLDNPLTGIGYRNFEANSIEIKKKYNLGHQDFKGHAHSNLLEALATTGIGGFLSLLLFHVFWFFETWKRDDLVGKIIPAVVVSLSVSGLFENTMSDGEIMYGLMALYAISAATMKRNSKKMIV